MKLNDVLVEVKGKPIHKLGSITVQEPDTKNNAIATTFPDEVSGNFVCTDLAIKFFKGCPRKVGKTFTMARNHLSLLVDGPKEVGAFDVSGNILTSLEGMPKVVEWIDVSENRLTSLKGNRNKILNGNFEAKHNRLDTLEGCPEIVGGDFHASYNFLESLKHGPKEVRGDFDVASNRLTSIDHLPISIGGSLILENNEITSLVGIHKLKSCTDIYFGSSKVTEGGIGLILIEGLIDINLSNAHKNPDFKKALEIINKYLRQGKKALLKCQEELEEAGLEAYAKL